MRHGQECELQIILKSEDPNVQKKAIKHRLESDISKDFRVEIGR